DLSVLFFARPHSGTTPPEVDQICTESYCGIRASVTALSKCALGRKAKTFTAALAFAGFLPSQECLSLSIFPACSETPGFPIDTAVWEVAANAPLISPATAAAATIAFDLIPTFLFCVWFCSSSRQRQAARSRS